MGIDAQFGRSLLRHILASRKVISMDIAELNPRFDMDGNTARLAAEMAYEWLVAPEQLSIP
jgi:formiminoglutamase